MERSAYCYLNPMNNLSKHKEPPRKYSANKDGPKSRKSFL